MVTPSARSEGPCSGISDLNNVDLHVSWNRGGSLGPASHQQKLTLACPEYLETHAFYEICAIWQYVGPNSQESATTHFQVELKRHASSAIKSSHRPNIASTALTTERDLGKEDLYRQTMSIYEERTAAH